MEITRYFLDFQALKKYTLPKITKMTGEGVVLIVFFNKYAGDMVADRRFFLFATWILGSVYV